MYLYMSKYDVHEVEKIVAIVSSLVFLLAISTLLTTTLALAPSCVDGNDVTASGDYDPDGDDGVAPFPVECDGDSVVVHHNREGRTNVNGYVARVSDVKTWNGSPVIVPFWEEWTGYRLSPLTVGQ